MGRDAVSVLLPALDEEETIGSVIDSLPLKGFKKLGYDVEIMVVDGHSKDRTQEIAAEKGATIIHQKGRGKGRAIQTAFEEFQSEFLFMMDADGTYPADRLIDMFPPLVSGRSDIVMGTRIGGTILPGAMSRMNYMGNRMLTYAANVLFPNNHQLTDLCTGMWGFNRDVIDSLDLHAPSFDIEAEIYAQCVKKGYRFREVPIEYKQRLNEPKLRSMRAGARIFGRLVYERFRR